MNVRKLRANLAAVLDRAAAGETVEITRDGVPVAVVGPVRGKPDRADAPDVDDIDRNLLGRRWIVPPGGHPLYDGRFGCWLSVRSLRCDGDSASPECDPVDMPPMTLTAESVGRVRLREGDTIRVVAVAGVTPTARPWWQFTPPFTVGGGEEWRASLDFGGVEYRLRGRPRAPGEIGPSLREVLGVLVGPAAVAGVAHADDLVTEVRREVRVQAPTAEGKAG